MTSRRDVRDVRLPGQDHLHYDGDPCGEELSARSPSFVVRIAESIDRSLIVMGIVFSGVDRHGCGSTRIEGREIARLGDAQQRIWFRA